MKLYNRIFTTLLAVILMLGAIPAFTVSVSAASSKTEEEDLESVYVGTEYNTPEEKLFGVEGSVDNLTGKFQLKLERNGFKLYVDPVSGEVAVYNEKTKDILFSNPYDTASSKGSDSTKGKLLSQLIVQYVDNGQSREMYSFSEAAMRDQIKVMNIKNGVRVEYTIGREESRKLVPRRISEENFKKFILGPMEEAVANGELHVFYYDKFVQYYLRQTTEGLSKRAAEQLILLYPVCETMNIYTLDSSATPQMINYCEQYIKNYCEDYTFEQMDADHEETGYEAKEVQYPVFKMALEYSLNEQGLSVRLPCNGLRYDMSAYTLKNLGILPFLGAGNSKNPGYNFFPDGAGSLFDFEKLNTNATTSVSGKVYGLDYAYHTIVGRTAYEKTIRYPVFGTVATEVFYTFTYGVQSKAGVKNYSMTVSSTVMSKEDIMAYIAEQGGTLSSEIVEESYKRGFVAVIEEGDSMADIETYHAGSESDFNAVRSYFNPKPSDSYDISDAISVVGSSTVTVVSERKYTGSIRIRYMMLTDEEKGAAIKAEDPSFKYYNAEWLGMAEVYRDYLVSNGTLKPLTNTEANIPLYVEVFGAFETMQTIATIPMNVMTPLTTFENIEEMYNKLSDKGVNNINFKLTGFANGGMFAEVPAALKWEKSVGGKAGFKALLEAANKINAEDGKHIGLYPDFDFAYIQRNSLFDSTVLKDDAVKTIDNRYTSYRQYSATAQMYVSFYQLAISPSRYSKFYNKLLNNYEGYDWKYMSIASLGTALNSDFDEEDPYNREDSKDFTVQAFEDMKNAGYSLMSDGANAYTWGYVDHLLNVDLDSSRYVKSSASVPFLGVVLHGYVQFAGAPLNEESDVDYALLRALENGAGLYFILSYQNTQELKENGILSQYYSVRYDIWEEDVIKYYNQMNGLLKDVQNKVIIDHKFLNEAERVLDPDELRAVLEAEMKAAAEAAKKELQDIETSKLLEVADAWQMAETAEFELQKIIDAMTSLNTQIQSNSNLINSYISTLTEKVTVFLGAIMNEQPSSEIAGYKDEMNLHITSIRTMAVNTLILLDQLEVQSQKATKILSNFENAESIIENSTTLDSSVKSKMIEEVRNYKANAQPLMDEVSGLLDWCSSRGYTKENTANTAAKIFTDKVVASGVYAPFQSDLTEAITKTKFTADDLLKESALAGGESTEDEQDQAGDSGNQYVSAENQVVVVTYGDRDSETYEKTAYKSFILNYNTYSVRVTYNDICYTIPSGGYVEIYH
ncbi:MAG: hypothetical protein IKA05_04390 [Clostridia bacterium]|nr:hypothetical protein [Clostridia bacterium]